MEKMSKNNEQAVIHVLSTQDYSVEMFDLDVGDLVAMITKFTKVLCSLTYRLVTDYSKILETDSFLSKVPELLNESHYGKCVQK